MLGVTKPDKVAYSMIWGQRA